MSHPLRILIYNIFLTFILQNTKTWQTEQNKCRFSRKKCTPAQKQVNEKFTNYLHQNFSF